MALTEVTVTGTYYAAGSPATGTVTFTPSAPLQDPAGNIIHAVVTTSVTLDASGQFSTTLLATDDVGVQPTGVTYRVVEHVSGGRRIYSIALTYTSPTVDLADVVPSNLTGVTYDASAGY